MGAATATDEWTGSIAHVPTLIGAVAVAVVIACRSYCL